MKFAPIAIPAMALLQQHDARRDILIEPAACSDRSSGTFRTGGRNWAVKTNWLVYLGTIICVFNLHVLVLCFITLQLLNSPSTESLK